MTEYRFTIPGKPYAKKRPRFSRKIGRAFDPAENAKAEQSVAAIAAQHIKTPMEGPVSVTITCVFQVPASLSKAKSSERLFRPHTQKPDVDNVAKWVCDGLNRIAWADDSQVSEIHVTKSWGRAGATHVTLEEVI